MNYILSILAFNVMIYNNKQVFIVFNYNLNQKNSYELRLCDNNE